MTMWKVLSVPPVLKGCPEVFTCQAELAKLADQSCTLTALNAGMDGPSTGGMLLIGNRGVATELLTTPKC